MGNTANSLPYEIGAYQEYDGNFHWQLNSGTKKGGDTPEEVSIFRFNKTHSDKLPLAQRSIQKLRTLKHPSVLGFVDSADVEEQLMLVTESCTPLNVWLAEQLSTTVTADDKALLFEEALWGFKCILTALSFLHSAGNMTHGFLGPHAIFVCKSGDWKLGSFDLAANTNVPADCAIVKQFGHLLGSPYQAPERKIIDDAALRHPVGSADIYSFSQIILKVAADIGHTLPQTTQRALQKLSVADPRKRLSAEAALALPLFTSEHLALLASLGDLPVKPTAECISILTSILPKLALLPKPVCVFKVVPAAGRVLQMALNDFPNRDSRESSRTAIDQALQLLSELARLGKVDENVFTSKCVPILCQLWPLSDRAVRTSLLKTCKHIVPLIPAPVFNKSMFESMLAGFADSNAKMREETLKNLVHVVDKLDEKHLQDKLVRCISSLQGDAEASIRTNVTIFLGKIAPKLKEVTRNKMLVSSFLKAMRDPFVHCRIAGLKAAVACLPLLEAAQLSKSLLPQLCVLLMDRHVDVRDQSMQLLESCLPIMKREMRRLTEQEQAAKARGGGGGDGDGIDGVSSSSSSSTGGGANSGGDGSAGASSFLSWAVDGLAKGLEKAAIASAGGAGPQPTSAEIVKPVTSASNLSNINTSSSNSSSSSSRTTPSKPTASAKTSTPAKPAVVALSTNAADFEDWDDGADLDVDDLDIDIPDTDPDNNNNKTTAAGGGGGGGGWGDDDDLDFDDNDDNNDNIKPAAAAAAAAAVQKPVASNNLNKSAGSSSSGSMKLPTPGANKQQPTAAKKSSWDDDDDAFNAVEVKVVEPKPAKSSSLSSKSATATTTTPTPPPPAAPAAVSSPAGMSLTSSSSSKGKASAGTAAAAAAPVKKAAVTKLAVDKSDWDDF